MKHVLAAYALAGERRVDADHDDLVCPDLDELEAQSPSKRPRRAGRMTRMACIGATRCLAQYAGQIASRDRLGVFHGTALGNMTETIGIVRQVVEHPDDLPSPIRFSCSMSNMSSFFVAQATGARGPNLLVSQEEFSFEGALLSAGLSGDLGECDHGLVGATDGLLIDRQDHVTALGCAPDARLGEGSGWLLLGPDSPDALGELVHVELLSAAGRPWIRQLAEKCRQTARPGETIHIMPGLGIDEATIGELMEQLPGACLQPYLDRTGVYPTALAAGLASLLSGPNRPGLHAHFASSYHHRLALVLVRIPTKP